MYILIKILTRIWDIYGIYRRYNVESKAYMVGRVIGKKIFSRDFCSFGCQTFIFFIIETSKL